MALALLVAKLALPAASRAQEARPAGAPPGTSEMPSSAPEAENSPQSSLSLAVDGQRERRDGGDTFTDGSLSIRARTPLVRRAWLGPDGFSAWGLVVQADARGFATDLAEVEGNGQFLRVGLSLGAYYAPSPRSAYWIQGGAFVAEQLSLLLDSPSVNPEVLALGTYRTSDRLKLRYGLGYTYAVGTGRLLPLLGVAWRLAPAWQADVLFPIRALLTWRATERLWLDAGARLASDLFRYRARDSSGQEDRQVLRIARLRLGISGRYALSAHIHLGLEIGVEGASIDTGSSQGRATGAYLGASVGYGSASPFQPAAPAEP